MKVECSELQKKIDNSPINDSMKATDGDRFLVNNKNTLSRILHTNGTETQNEPSGTFNSSAQGSNVGFNREYQNHQGPELPIQVKNNKTICQNCMTTNTPLWRRDENGQIMCNACGLFLKLHGRKRPISLKTDVIKSRNRTNRSTPNKKKCITKLQETDPAFDDDFQLKKRPINTSKHSPSLQQSQEECNPVKLPGISSMPMAFPVSPAMNPYASIYFSPPVVPSSICNVISSGIHPLDTPLNPHSGPHKCLTPAFPDNSRGRGASSERLTPFSPDLDRIPRLSHVPVSTFQKQHIDKTIPRTIDGGIQLGNSELLSKVKELELVNDLLKRRISDLERADADSKAKIAELGAKLQNK